MSKKQHQKQLQRARTKRQQSKYDRRAARNKVVIIVMAVLMVLSLVAAGLSGLLAGDDPPQPEIEDPSAADETAEEASGPCPSAADQQVPDATEETYDEPPRFEVEDDVTYVAILETTCGDIEVELDTQGAPRTAENFLALAEDGFYEGVPFHRTIEGFMIQGGDPTGSGTGGPGYALEDELETAEALEPFPWEDAELEAMPEDQQELAQESRAYPRGTLAMANSGPDTQGSQFFIVHGDPAPLAPSYTLFGEVLDGMDVVDDIAAGPVGGMTGDQALDPVVITGVTIERR